MEGNLKMIYDSCCYTSGFDLSSKTRKEEVVYFRNIYFYFAKKLTTASLHRIGGLANRDHSTVLHGIRKYKEYIIYPDFYKLSELVKENLPIIVETDKTLTPQEQEIKRLRLTNENLKAEILSLKNQLESRKDKFLIEISKLPEEQRNEFRDFKWYPHKKMLESRVRN